MKGMPSVCCLAIAAAVLLAGFPSWAVPLKYHEIAPVGKTLTVSLDYDAKTSDLKVSGAIADYGLLTFELLDFGKVPPALAQTQMNRVPDVWVMHGGTLGTYRWSALEKGFAIYPGTYILKVKGGAFSGDAVVVFDVPGNRPDETTVWTSRMKATHALGAKKFSSWSEAVRAFEKGTRTFEIEESTMGMPGGGAVSVKTAVNRYALSPTYFRYWTLRSVDGRPYEMVDVRTKAFRPLPDPQDGMVPSVRQEERLRTWNSEKLKSVWAGHYDGCVRDNAVLQLFGKWDRSDERKYVWQREGVDHIVMFGGDGKPFSKVAVPKK